MSDKSIKFSTGQIFKKFFIRSCRLPNFHKNLSMNRLNRRPKKTDGGFKCKIYFLAAAAFLALCRLQITQSGPAMQSEEIAPETIPNAIGMAKVRRVDSPNSSETVTIVITATKVVSEVMMFLLKEVLMLVLTTSPISASGIRRAFSRTRS